MNTRTALGVRKQRWEGILLTIISTIFIAAGVFILCVVGNPWLAATAIPFFGAMLPIGVFQIVRPGRDLPSALATICCFGLAASGVALILTEVLEIHALGRRQGAALPVGIIITIVFGGGGMLLLLRQMRRRRSTRRQT